jgi:ADP-ribosyl-[dinitrogen reductase] hydrolase
MNKSELRRVGERLIPTIAYGDSVGLPYEGGPAQLPGSVRGLQAMNAKYLGKQSLGTWSDDTHLSIAVARSLIEHDGFDLASQAKWHIRALNQVELQPAQLADQGLTFYPDMEPAVKTTDGHTGWGAGTTDSVHRLRDENSSPEKSGAPDSAGNGVLMKMAPLVYWQIARKTPTDEAEQQIVQLTKMTHAAEEAIVCSIVHQAYLMQLASYTGGQIAIYRMFGGFQSTEASRIESRRGSKPIVSRYLGALAEPGYDLNPARIQLIAPKHGFYAPETLAMAYGSFALSNQLPDAIYRAVELGGDSDSIGSIVGTMSLFAYGQQNILTDEHRLFDYTRLQRISHELTAAAMGESK